MTNKYYIIQNIVFSDKCCEKKELYVRSNGNIECNGKALSISTGSSVSTDTYINLLDGHFWSKYSLIDSLMIGLEIKKGSGYIRLMKYVDGKDTEIKKVSVDADKEKQINIPFINDGKGYYYITIIAESDMCIENASFYTEKKLVNEVKLALIICTYKRQKYIESNVQQLKKSLFFNKRSHLDGKLNVIIVDNNSELLLDEGERIRIIHNENTGGSGGFKRGIQELRKECEYSDITHVIFMDDDVEFMNESLYRLFNLYLFANDSNYYSVTAGRMFRTDDRKIQYTAAEIWNGGQLKHIGLNRNMTDKDYMPYINDNEGAEYGGWWMCCYPVDFVKSNDPFPFFLHCDDVEYGLRFNKTPIIMNGVQVWHQTYEYRINPQITYYDVRNSMIVNTIYDYFETRKDCMICAINMLDNYYLYNDRDASKMAIIAVLDYLNPRGIINNKGIFKIKRTYHILSKHWGKARFMVKVGIFLSFNRVKRIYKEEVKQYTFDI